MSAMHLEWWGKEKRDKRRGGKRDEEFVSSFDLAPIVEISRCWTYSFWSWKDIAM
jgi:hypothetical protein